MNNPIVVNATPTQDQLAAGLRQLLLALSSIASVLGYTKVAGELSAALTIVGPVAMIITIVLGQIYTRRASQKLIITATAAPDSVAVVKPVKAP